YSSAQCVPVAVRVEQLKKFMWITSCISSAVLENRNLKYVFRAQPSGRQFGMMSMDFIAKNAKEKLKKDPKDVKVAIIHEDGAYGIDVAKGNEEGARKAGFNLVLKEGYAATAPDLSSLVIKLKRARPDVLFHTGYNPDIVLFLRQAREQGLKLSASVGMAASNTYVFMSEVLPRAIKKYGGIDADALRKAALEVDLSEGGTMLGFGVHFLGDGAMAGQNDRAFPVIVQYIDDKAHVV